MFPNLAVGPGLHATSTRYGSADLPGHTTMIGAASMSHGRVVKQTSLASLEYAGKKRPARRDEFLGEMGKVVS